MDGALIRVGDKVVWAKITGMVEGEVLAVSRNYSCVKVKYQRIEETLVGTFYLRWETTIKEVEEWMVSSEICDVIDRKATTGV